MITFYRSATILPGKTPQAIAFAKKIAEYVKKSTGLDLHVGVPIGGNPSRIGWSASYESLAALEAQQTKMTSDAKYWEMVNKSADLFAPGSLHDEMWRSI